MVYTKYYASLMVCLVRYNVPKVSAAIGIALFDSTIWVVISFYPMYYLIQDFCHTGRFAPLLAIRTTWKNLYLDIRAMLSFFFPLTVLTLLFVPVHLRAISITSVATLWAMILSKIRGNYQQVEKEIDSSLVTLVNN